MASVLAAPVWVATCVMVGGWPAMFGGEPALAVQRLAPLLTFNSSTDRSAEFGFLPDSLWPHLGYLLGLVLLAGVGLLLLAARGGGHLRPAPVLAAVLVGVVLVAAGGMGVVILPHRLVVLGPDRADWRPLSQVTAESGRPAVVLSRRRPRPRLRRGRHADGLRLSGLRPAAGRRRP